MIKTMRYRARLRIALLVVGLFILLLIPILMRGQPASPIPATGTPFTISDAEIKKITREQMVATLKHVLRLYREAQEKIDRQEHNLADASGSLKDGLGATTKSLNTIDNLTKEIGDLKKHDEKMTGCCNECSKKLWWYRLRFWGAWIVFGLGVIACIVLAFLKFTGRLAIFGTAVASKIP
jgi:hypothetical protein